MNTEQLFWILLIFVGTALYFSPEIFRKINVRLHTHKLVMGGAPVTVTIKPRTGIIDLFEIKPDPKSEAIAKLYIALPDDETDYSRNIRNLVYLTLSPEPIWKGGPDERVLVTPQLSLNEDKMRDLRRRYKEWGVGTVSKDRKDILSLPFRSTMKIKTLDVKYVDGAMDEFASLTLEVSATKPAEQKT